MLDQDLQKFSQEIKKGFNEVLGSKSYFAKDRVIRFFTDELTGDECAIVVRNGQEICVTAEEGREMWINQNQFVR